MCKDSLHLIENKGFVIYCTSYNNKQQLILMQVELSNLMGLKYNHLKINQV